MSQEQEEYVRIPSELLKQIDELVEAFDLESREAFVEAAVRRLIDRYRVLRAGNMAKTKSSWEKGGTDPVRFRDRMSFDTTCFLAAAEESHLDTVSQVDFTIRLHRLPSVLRHKLLLMLLRVS